MNNKIFILFFVLFASLFTSISAQSKHHKKAKSNAKATKIIETKEPEKVAVAVKIDTFNVKTILDIDSLDFYYFRNSIVSFK